MVGFTFIIPFTVIIPFEGLIKQLTGVFIVDPRKTKDTSRFVKKTTPLENHKKMFPENSGFPPQKHPMLIRFSIINPIKMDGLKWKNPIKMDDFGVFPYFWFNTRHPARLTVFDVLGKSLLEKVADVTNNAKQCL